MGALYNQWQVLKRLRFLSQCGRRSGRNGKRKVLPATFELNQVFAVILFPNGTCTVPWRDMFCCPTGHTFTFFSSLTFSYLIIESQ